MCRILKYKNLYLFILIIFLFGCDDGANKNKKSDSSTLSNPSVSLSNPLTSPGSIANPTLHITSIASNDTINIYSDSSCSTLVKTEISTSDTLDLEVPSLSNDGTYYFYATKTQNGKTTSCPADGLKYDFDHTPPSAPSNFSYSNSSTSLTESPTASWSAVSDNSGILRYELALGSSAISTDIQSWTSLNTNLTGLLNNFAVSLVRGSNYYLQIRAIDNAGNISTEAVGSAWVASDSTVQVTITSPTLSLMSPLSSPNSSAKPKIRVSGLTSGDVVKLYSDSTCSTIINSVNASGTTVEIDIATLTVDGSYYFYATRTQNSISSDCSTSNVKYDFDQTPPLAPSNLSYASSSSSLTVSPTATWTASSDASGILRYEMAIGTSPSSTDVKGWTSIGNVLSGSLTNFDLVIDKDINYYIRIRALDKAGNISNAISGTAWTVPAVVSVVQNCALKSDGSVSCWGQTKSW